MATNTKSGQTERTVDYDSFLAEMEGHVADGDAPYPVRARRSVEAWADAHNLADRPRLSTTILMLADSEPSEHWTNSTFGPDDDQGAVLAALAVDVVVADILSS